MHIYPCTLTAKFIIFETTAQIPEVEYEDKYGHMIFEWNRMTHPISVSPSNEIFKAAAKY